MLTNEINSDIEKILLTQPDPPLNPNGGDYPNRADIPKKLAAFEKLVRHAMSRFSNDRMYEILKFAYTELKTRDKKQRETPVDKSMLSPKENNNNGTQETTNDTATLTVSKGPDSQAQLELKNYQQVSVLIGELKERIDKGTDKEKRVVKLFDFINKELKYLKDARSYFDEHIHWKLLEDYYDPKDGIDFNFAHRQNSLLVPTSSSTPTNGHVSDTLKKPSKEKSQKKSDEKIPQENEKFLLAKTVWNLKDLLNKWLKLVGDNDLEEKAFDPDSQYELAQYGNSAHFGPLLRLIPDLFTKCYKAVEISREWIKLAENIYTDRLPLKTVYKREQTFQKEPSMASIPEVLSPISPETAARQYQQDIQVLENKIQEVAIVLKQNETELVKLTAEMSKLQEMDMRVGKLSSEFENADAQLEQAQKEYSKCLFEREQAIDKISEAQSGSQSHLDRVKRARELEVELGRRQSELEFLEFQKTVIQEDYLLELELRPNFVYFMGDVETKILDIKIHMDNQTSQRNDLEEQLSELKNTTNHMKEETQRFLNSEETRLSFAMSDIVSNGHPYTDVEMLAQRKRNKTDTSMKSDIAESSYTSSDDVELRHYMHNPSKTTHLHEKQRRKIIASDGQRNWYQSQSTEQNRLKSQKRK